MTTEDAEVVDFMARHDMLATECDVDDRRDAEIMAEIARLRATGRTMAEIVRGLPL
jgi:hypothetical protein